MLEESAARHEHPEDGEWLQAFKAGDGSVIFAYAPFLMETLVRRQKLTPRAIRAGQQGVEEQIGYWQ